MRTREESMRLHPCRGVLAELQIALDQAEPGVWEVRADGVLVCKDLSRHLPSNWPEPPPYNPDLSLIGHMEGGQHR